MVVIKKRKRKKKSIYDKFPSNKVDLSPTIQLDGEYCF